MRERFAQNRLRRYPALGFLAVAGGLALMLPSTLTRPAAEPASLSEFAPVPGKAGAGSSLADLRTAQGTDGIGSSLRGATPTPSRPVAPVRKLSQGRPSLKACVGTPPRQTEDPLSPPCVASFEGDNGGATTRGVDRDEFRVVLYVGPASGGTKLIDYEDETATDPSAADEAFRGFARPTIRFFNDRYQTYGRRGHFWVYGYDAGNRPPSDAQVVDIIDRVDPFAIIAVGSRMRWRSGGTRPDRSRAVRPRAVTGWRTPERGSGPTSGAKAMPISAGTPIRARVRHRNGPRRAGNGG